jgi:hypothetical protein
VARVRMRAFVVLACLILAACSSSDYNPPPVSAPDRETATTTAKTASNEEKLVGSVEVSAVREAHPISPGSYILCLRGAGNHPRRRVALTRYFSKTTIMLGPECRS